MRKTKSDLPKLFTRLPKDMKEFFIEKAKDRNYPFTGTMLSNLLSDYLDNPGKYPLTGDDILKYENLKKDEKYFSFYCKREDELRLKKLAMSNLRQSTDQILFFLYAMYNHLITEDQNQLMTSSYD